MKISENKPKSGLSVRLKKLRLEHGETQAQVAAKLGISQQMYSRYENKDVILDSETLRKICLLYNVSADYLLDIESTPIGKTPELATNIDLIVEKVITKINRHKDY